MSDAEALGIAEETRTPRAMRGEARRLSSTSASAPVSSLFGEWARILRRLDISPALAVELANRARVNGTDVLAELLAASIVPESRIYREIARELGVMFEPELDPADLRLGAADALLLLRARRGVGLVQAVDPHGRLLYVAAPGYAEFSQLRRLSAVGSPEATRLRIVPPTVLRAALLALARPRLVGLGRDALFVRRPHLSARFVANAWQGGVLGSLLVGLPVVFLHFPVEAFLLLHLLFSLAFLACITLRLAAAYGPDPPRLRSVPRVNPASLPVYTVLVALRNEVEIVPELLVALGRLQWPRSKLEVKLICEADDRATIDAIRAHGLRHWVEIIEVPPGMPQTKPNALSFALPLARGDFVVLYDAEDRPHPLQLVEAWQRFGAEGPDLGCLQAPIRIDNADAGILPAMFATEYAALFGRLLPFLARFGSVLPLGGTSNHFRREMLDEVGAWDPYNVTEDADLGVRLARYGYRTGVLTLPTGEDAPDTPLVWLRQRTRWFKGWGQSWLVHMRYPSLLARELGPTSFLVVQVMFAGMLVSALGHPLLLIGGVGLVAKLLAGELGAIQRTLLAIDIANVVLGYGAFLLLGWRALGAAGRDRFGQIVLFTPIYWLMISAAAWRALPQLYFNPHHWEKTPHKRRRRPAQTPRGASSPERDDAIPSRLRR